MRTLTLLLLVVGMLGCDAEELPEEQKAKPPSVKAKPDGARPGFLYVVVG